MHKAEDVVDRGRDGEREKDRALGWRGRGAGSNPTGRFERFELELLPEGGQRGKIATQVFGERVGGILSYNDSPDVGFSVSLNPYRGCEHGCIYCYARPTHEYLGFSAGLDFESKIVAKQGAAEVLRRELGRPGYRARAVAMSGVTDPYQPVEKSLGVTRSCLEVLAACRHPVVVVTKSALVERDIDLLGELAGYGAAAVFLSVTSLDGELARRMEPRASGPCARLGAIRRLADAGIPVGVMVAPVVPMLNEPEIVAILEAAAAAGASFAGMTVVRLPHGVAGLFRDWLGEHFPDRAEAIMGRVEAMQGPSYGGSGFGDRMRGVGIYAEQIAQLFEIGRRRAGLARRAPGLRDDAFRRPLDSGGQMDFGF